MQLADRSTSVGDQPYDNSWENPSLGRNQTAVARKGRSPGRNVFYSKCPNLGEDHFLTGALGKGTSARHHWPLHPRPLESRLLRTAILAKVNHTEMNIRMGRTTVLINNKSRLSPRRRKPARTK